MITFLNLWQKHPVAGQYVCDSTLFENQCAMRTGEALRSVGVSLAIPGLKTCVDYNRRRFASHAPGHVLRAQELADVLKRTPSLLGTGTSRDEWKGSINKNIDNLKNRNGLIFIYNGWGPTDHIDLWNGHRRELRAGLRSFFGRGKAIWFWEIKR